MEALYCDVFGQPIEKSKQNAHHVFARCTVKGKGGVFRHFINQRGLVLPMVKTIHNELHARLEFPPVPSLTLIHRMNSFISGVESQNPYDRFVAITGEFERIAEECPNSSHREQSKYIADNLQRQSEFILLGQVQIIKQEAA